MLFNSLEFPIFLLIVYCLYWVLGRRRQNVLLVIASSMFYGWWDWRFLALLWYSVVFDYLVGLRIDASDSLASRRRWLALSVAGNLGLLGFFKYFNFFIESAAQLLIALGLEPNQPSLRIILPVGISFYTFQTLSYTIDIYRRNMEAEREFSAYAAYVMFFPQLVAGPIERATRFLPQFKVSRTFDVDAARDGVRQILWGFFKKMAVADLLAVYVNTIYADPAQASSWELLGVTYCFALQIYCDFSGYSDIAVGTARLFGFSLMRNFAYPYFAVSIRDFWSRWHISLSTWFRDYVYVPLGGNRVSALRHALNVFATFTLSGLWHGAKWTFVVWGAVHGLLVMAEHVVDRRRRPRPVENVGGGLRLGRIVRVVVTFHLVVLLWVFFRATSVSQALAILAKILSPTGWPTFDPAWLPAWLVLCVLVALEWTGRLKPHVLAGVWRMAPLRRRVIYAAVVAAIFLLNPTTHVPFIYFQF